MTNAELVLDDISGFSYDSDYQRNYQLDHFNIKSRKATAIERLEPFSRLRRYLLRRWSNRFPFRSLLYYQQLGVEFDSLLLNLKPAGTVYLEGYWQSEDYFKDVESLIRDDLRIIAPVDAANQETARRIRSCQAVAVHVRYFDARTDHGVNNTPQDYYLRAISTVEKIVSNAHYFVFSDQPEKARTVIPLSDNRVTYVTHNKSDACAYADLWLMSLCRHFIIANSTFSWWGAWLSAHADKKVVAPGFVIQGPKASWGFDGLIPDEWIKL